MTIFGTRPEVIKIVQIIRKLRELGYQVIICVTAQQREMLDQSLDFFEIILDYDLNIMEEHQDFFLCYNRNYSKIKNILKGARPDIILIQGDTTTAFYGKL